MYCFWCWNPCWSHPFPCWCIYIDVDLTSIETWTDIGLQEPRYVQRFQIQHFTWFLFSLPGDHKFHKVISSSSTRHSTGICLIKDIILHEHLHHSLVSDHSHHSGFIQEFIYCLNLVKVWNFGDTTFGISLEILAMFFRIAFNLRTRWIQEKWQEDAVDGTLQERKSNMIYLSQQCRVIRKEQ